jgi:hypothetical protein
MNMEAIKDFLAPLGLNTSSIQDTLVCILRSFPALSQDLQLYFAETGCHWWHSRDCPKSLDICMEWICGLFVPLSEAIWLAEVCVIVSILSHRTFQPRGLPLRLASPFYHSLRVCTHVLGR